MRKLLSLVGATVGGAAGWWLGAHLGLMTALALGLLGTGAGIFAGRRVARDHFE